MHIVCKSLENVCHFVVVCSDDDDDDDACAVYHHVHMVRMVRAYTKEFERTLKMNSYMRM